MEDVIIITYTKESMDRITTAAPPIYYPESDGKPMGETDVHIDA
jgi:hypothetical protein